MVLTRAQAYADAGVDIATGNEVVSKIKGFALESRTQGVLSDIGGFSGLFKLDLSGIQEPILVSSTDGVGTKLKLAFEFNKHDTIGIDLVAMCVNDILVQGARPLFFLDYFATAKLNIDTITDVIGGITEGCKQAGCALIGGETAELPDMYTIGEYDLAGFCTGIVDNNKIVDGSSIKVGDVIIGLASSGLHANGYALIRKIFRESGRSMYDIVPGSTSTFQDVLLEPTVIYTEVVKNILRELPISGMVHITGGGFYDNIPRVLPATVIANIYFGVWKIQPIFHWLKEQSDLEWSEMLQIFNCGIGYIFIISKDILEEVMSRLSAMQINAWIIGNIDHRKDSSEQINVVFE